MTSDQIQFAVDKFAAQHGYLPDSILLNRIDYITYTGLDPLAPGNQFVSHTFNGISMSARYRTLIGEVEMCRGAGTIFAVRVVNIIPPTPPPQAVSVQLGSPLPPAGPHVTATQVLNALNTPNHVSTNMIGLKEFLDMYPERKLMPKCECGAAKVGSANHSSWCPA